MRKKIIGLFVFVLIVLTSIFIYHVLSFHVTSSDPAGGSIPTTQQVIVFSTNEGLRNIDKSQVSISPSILDHVAVSKNQIFVYLNQTIAIGKKITVYITDVTSVSGKKLTIHTTFTAKYVTQSKLSPEEKKRELSKQDTTYNTYPLLNLLPLITNNYQITYKLPDTGQKKALIIITSLEIPANNPTAEPGSPSWLAAVSDARTQAITWLKQNGFNTTSYQLGFSENYLLKEFNGIYVNPY